MLHMGRGKNHGAKGDRFDDIHLVFQRGVKRTCRQGCHHSAAHRAVKNGAVPAAMHGAHRVGDMIVRAAFEGCAALGHMAEVKAHCWADAGSRDLSIANGL